MNKIGFKNFRKFAEFKPLEYGGITFLVGRNNAGKSTLVKALLLIIDYLKADKINTFSFNQNNIEDVNIVTFERALNRKAQVNKDDIISFNITIEDFIVNLTITGLEDRTEVKVMTLEIENISNGFKFIIKPQESSVTLTTTNISPNDIITENNQLIELQKKRNELAHQSKTFNSKTSTEFIKLNEELKLIKKKIKDLSASLKANSSSGNFNLHSFYNYNTLREILKEAIEEHFAEYQTQYNEIQRGKKPKKIFESLSAFREYRFRIEQSLTSLYHLQYNTENIYLGASLIKQSALFAIRDNKNALAQAIHEFVQLGINNNKSSEAYRFVKEWMGGDRFSVGDNFEIEMYAGEAYQVKIDSFGKLIHLADKGMGSIQAMLLLIRLATVIHKRLIFKKNYTVIIEEPELNLHPALQSLLADLFFEVNNKYEINFIVETHSEYLIRKSQLLVKEKELEISVNDNPFNVYYFDDEKGPYKMNYRADGKFIEEFGTGFFDETRNIVKKMI